jgi:hypothetical protein
MSMSITTNIIMNMGKIAPAAATIITTIMPTTCLPVGEKKRPTPIPTISFLLY